MPSWRSPGSQELATPGRLASRLDRAARASPEARCNDATLGTAGVLLGALWALRHGVPGAAELADHAVDVLLAEQEPRDDGTYWPFVPLRFLLSASDVQMPNWSHGQAGIAGSLAAAGMALDRPDLVDAAAASGAEHLLTLGRHQRRRPPAPSLDPRARTTSTPSPTPGATDRPAPPCCSPPSTAPGFPPSAGRHAVRLGAGLPALAARLGNPRAPLPRLLGQRRPLLRHGRRRRCRPQRLAAARPRRRPRLRDHPGDALVDRAIDDGDHAYWRFVEHRNADPLLPPGPGWMQGAAGIAAYLFRLARVLEQGRGAEQVARMDTWWAGPQ